MLTINTNKFLYIYIYIYIYILVWLKKCLLSKQGQGDHVLFGHFVIQGIVPIDTGSRSLQKGMRSKGMSKIPKSMVSQLNKTFFFLPFLKKLNKDDWTVSLNIVIKCFNPVYKKFNGLF